MKEKRRRKRRGKARKREEVHCGGDEEKVRRARIDRMRR